MVYDAQHALEHPEVAAWALGALDPGDAASFEEHLRSCEQCQEQAAEFAPVACNLPLAAPAAEPPPDLELKILAAVRYAVMAESRTEPEPEPERRPEPVAPNPGPASKVSRWWHFHWTNPLLSVVTALGAAAVTAAVFIGVHVFQPAAPAVAASYNLRPQPGQPGSATATARDTAGGYEIQLTAKNLPRLGSGQFFECWYAGPDNRPGHKELISGGTFASSNGSFTMWTAADLDTFKVMQITEEQAGKGSQQGKIILSGTARTSTTTADLGRPPRVVLVRPLIQDRLSSGLQGTRASGPQSSPIPGLIHVRMPRSIGGYCCAQIARPSFGSGG